MNSQPSIQPFKLVAFPKFFVGKQDGTKKVPTKKTVEKNTKHLVLLLPPPLHLTKSIISYPQQTSTPTKQHRLRGVVAVPET